MPVARSRDQRFFDRVTALERGRVVEATGQQLAASGAAGSWGVDPVDGDVGYRRVGAGLRSVPWWTLEKARAFSVAGYRVNPMARAIIDTHVAFCVGDSGLTLTVASEEVRAVAEAFWSDPAVMLGSRQEPMLRSHLLNGESLYQMMVGALTGVCRVCPTDPSIIADVSLRGGNPWWPETVHLRDPRGGVDTVPMSVAQVDELTGLRAGEVLFWPSFQALETDVRGYPFLGPVLDWLDSYDQVLSNLIDRTALARYLVWDVTVEGDQADVNKFIEARGGTHAPRSGTVEVHTNGVTWEPKTAQSGTYEDTNTAKAVMTQVAGGAGLSKHWLAEPEDANRATSLSMAEPVRRRLSSVQNTWVYRVTEMVRFAVDQAVAANMIPAEVDVATPTGSLRMRAADTVTITAPQIAAADAQVNAAVMVSLAGALSELVGIGALSSEAAKVAAKKAWEDYTGTPYRAELDAATPDVDDIATTLDSATAVAPIAAALAA